jgi:DNA-binding NarL/FixJ family response regulator
LSIRILVVDDHCLIRRGLCSLLEFDPTMNVVGEAGNAEEAIERALAVTPDVILMDVNMPGTGGIEATRQLHHLLPDARVLILTVQEDEEMLMAALKVGAAGYITKRAADSELTDAIRAVARGDLYIHPTMTRKLLREMAAHTALPPSPEEEISPRAREVLQLLARGCTNREIAEQLQISVRTVEGHRAGLMARLGLHSRSDLVTYAAQHHLIP